jgi:hypothetical protein
MPDALARAVDPRNDARSNVFLAAALSAGSASYAVRIRNISAMGALLDGASLPAAGSVARLRRGRLGVECEIVWHRSDTCGVRFGSEVKVEDWVRRVEHGGQKRVDNVIAALRNPAAAARPVGLAPAGDTLDCICADLSSLCEQLATSEEVMSARPEEMIELDTIVQRLAKIIALSPREQ